MNKNRTVTFIVLMFLVVGATLVVAQNDRAGARPALTISMQYENNLLSVSIQSATIKEVFEELKKQTGLTYEMDKEIEGQKVTVEFKDLSLKAGVEKILDLTGLKNLAISYKEVTSAPGHQSPVGAGSKPAQHEVSRVEIRKRTKAEIEKIEEAEQKEADEEARQRDREYHELFARMAKEKNKVAKALSDFSNPKATQKQKTQVMTYLRQATIEPKDKPLLRNALLDSKYDDLKGAVEMGLIHAIIDHPEESDKEYMLGLLKRRSGFLLMAMKFIWDDRFIPGLIDIVRNGKSGTGRNDAAEILGVRKVKEAVPALEDALAQMWGKDDITDVHSALTQITGMSYRVVGGKAVAFPYQKPALGEGIFIPGK